MKGRFTTLYENLSKEDPEIKKDREEGIVLEEKRPLLSKVVVAESGKKRGRPELWIPRPMTADDKKCTVDLMRKYGPDQEAATKFEKKFAEFMTLNPDVLPADALEAAIGQARNMGAAFSSMDTQFSTLVGRRKTPDIGSGWAALRMLSTAHADADPVQPRTWETKDGVESMLRLLLELGELKTPGKTKKSVSSLEMKALGYACCATGARAQTIVRLRCTQAALTDTALWVQRRWSKVCKTRRHRDTLEYLFEWSLPPPEDVRQWLLKKFEEGKKDPELLLFSHPALQESKAATSLTSFLRRTKEGGAEITSYCFRDWMDEELRQHDLTEAHLERLLEHSEVTSRASYQRTDISRAQGYAIRKKAVAKKEQLASTKKKAVAKKKKK